MQGGRPSYILVGPPEELHLPHEGECDYNI